MDAVSAEFRIRHFFKRIAVNFSIAASDHILDAQSNVIGQQMQPKKDTYFSLYRGTINRAPINRALLIGLC